VTVCIAGVADDGETIVTVTDRKVGFGSLSADKAVFKSDLLGYKSLILTAGNDVARARNVIEKSKPRIREEMTTKEENDPRRMAEIVFEECNAERDRVIEASVLKRRGYTWKIFKDAGKDFCTEAVYFDMQNEISAVKLSLDFLVVGFDGKKQNPHIFYTNWETPPECYDDLGFYAIGSGAANAISYLAHAVEYLDYGKAAGKGTVLYHLMAAKFMAESAQDVGRDTFPIIFPKDGPILTTHPLGGDDFIRDKWKKAGAPRLPPEIDEAMNAIICNPSEWNSRESLGKASKFLKRAKKALARK
jgi:hypothetical protein